MSRNKPFSALWLVALVTLMALSCGSDDESPTKPAPGPPQPQMFTANPVNTYPHDTLAFTQGLVFDNGVFIEGTGKNFQSNVRRVEITTGNVLLQRPTPKDLFGEGITLMNGEVLQLTQFFHEGYRYNKDTLDSLGIFFYPTLGWGITHDSTNVIMSDGSKYLFFRDPVTFNELSRLEVLDANSVVDDLNELEFINGRVYANIWKSDSIAIINPDNGFVEAWIDCSGLPNQPSDPDAVLNGIAYDPVGDRLFVTGKLWPNVFEITLVPVP